MKKEPGFFSNLILSILLAVVAVYVLSFLNIVPNSMQVDLPHYMYPDVMPASGTRAYDAQKARERLGKKLHRELVELGLEEEEEKELCETLGIKEGTLCSDSGRGSRKQAGVVRI